jgi:hypothetical protein
MFPVKSANLRDKTRLLACKITPICPVPFLVIFHRINITHLDFPLLPSSASLVNFIMNRPA